MRLAGRVAVVSGAAGGIGSAIALALAREGARIGAIDIDREGSEAVAAEIRENDTEALAMHADLSRRGDVAAALEAIRKRFGRFDIAVSGIAYEEHTPLLAAEADAIRKSLDITALSAFHLCQLSAREMVERGEGGKIILINSLHAIAPFAGTIGYNMAEAALRQLGRSMAHELAPHRINVNLIEPGWIDTPGERRWHSDTQLRELGSRLPWGRLGTPNDIAHGVVYLASPEADYVTGTSLRIDGGLLASMPRLPTLEETGDEDP